MDANDKRELNSIKNELNSIIKELESISYGIRTGFSGIGNAQCADCIDRVANQYRLARNKLYNLNTDELTEEYMQNNAFGGGAGGGGAR